MAFVAAVVDLDDDLDLDLLLHLDLSLDFDLVVEEAHVRKYDVADDVMMMVA